MRAQYEYKGLIDGQAASCPYLFGDEFFVEYRGVMCYPTADICSTLKDTVEAGIEHDSLSVTSSSILEDNDGSDCESESSADDYPLITLADSVGSFVREPPTFGELIHPEIVSPHKPSYNLLDLNIVTEPNLPVSLLQEMVDQSFSRRSAHTIPVKVKPAKVVYYSTQVVANSVPVAVIICAPVSEYDESYPAIRANVCDISVYLQILLFLLWYYSHQKKASVIRKSQLKWKQWKFRWKPA